MPTANVPPVGRVAAKWARRAGSASGEYEEGVRNTTRSWSGAATAAAGNYKAGVTAAAAEGRFEKGVGKAGDAKWKRGAVEKGPGRFSQGVQAAEQDFSAGVAPFLELIGRTDLPARGPVGSAGNYQRVQRLGEALHKARVGR
jgi:hypothetical protein